MADGVMGADELWAGFTLDPRTPGHVDLRASDADRDRIASVLSAAYADGRLDREELDERTTALAATRTLGDLPPLVHDLVAPATAPVANAAGALDLTSATGPDLQARAVREWESQRRGALLGFLFPTIICWAVWASTSASGPGFDPTFPWPLFVTGGTAFALLRVLLRRQEILDEELRRLQAKQAKALGRTERWRDRP